MGLGRHEHGAGSTSRGPYAALASHYTVGRTIGEGTFGKVRKGVHRLTKIKVAIKILEKRRIKDGDDVERVSREIHIMKHMKHPNIINLFEVLDTKRFVFLIMEYAAGGELFDFIVRNTRVHERLAAEFFHHIINGIDYCHKANVIHRDLKPENLLLDANSNIKIVDFGLSNIQSPDGILTTACGSPCYAPPEMIQGRPYFGARADIWSAGVILYALLCGYLPFEDSNTAVLYKKICQGRYDVPEWISPSARDLLARLLQTDPDKRLNVDDIRLHPWYAQSVSSTDPGQQFGGTEYSKGSERIVDEILDEMKALGYDTGATVNSVLNQLHDPYHATYQLLLHRHQTLGASARIPAHHHESVGDVWKSASALPPPNHSGEKLDAALPSGWKHAGPGPAARPSGSVTHRSRPDHAAWNDGSITVRRPLAGVSVKYDQELLVENSSPKSKKRREAKPVRRPMTETGESPSSAVVPPLTLDNIERALELALTSSRAVVSSRNNAGRRRRVTPRSHRRPCSQRSYEGLSPQSPVTKIYAQAAPRRFPHPRIAVKGIPAAAPAPSNPLDTPRRSNSMTRTPVPPNAPRPRGSVRSGRRTSVPTSWRA